MKGLYRVPATRLYSRKKWQLHGTTVLLSFEDLLQGRSGPAYNLNANLEIAAPESLPNISCKFQSGVLGLLGVFLVTGSACGRYILFGVSICISRRHNFLVQTRARPVVDYISLLEANATHKSVLHAAMWDSSSQAISRQTPLSMLHLAEDLEGMALEQDLSEG